MSDFLFITHDNNNPYFNLASEEYLLRRKDGFYVYLWVNSPAVIVGVNQNAVEEVNLDYTSKNNVAVIRRQTGGGAVYHDLNNVCYTVIAPYDSSQDNYKKFTLPVIEYLKTLGVTATFTGRNDIEVDGKKISGNAQTVYGNRIMHHGTLLFKSDINALTGALKPNKLKTESKGIKSVRARVTNIYDLLENKITLKEFLSGLREYYKSRYDSYDFTDGDIKEIWQLVADKYSKHEWNIGRSPKGKNVMEKRFDFGTLKITFDTENGLIQNARITGDFFSLKPIEILAELLNGIPYEVNAVRAALSNANEYIVNAKGEDIVKAIFE